MPFQKVNMKNLRHSCFSRLILLFFIATIGSAHTKPFTPTYTVTALGILPGYSQEVVSDINNHGDAVGVALGNTYDTAVLIHNRKVINIAPVANGNSYANAINAKGVVVGLLGNNSTQPYVSFIYYQGKLSTFQAPNAFVTYASSINDIGQIAGNFSPIGSPLNENDHIFIRQANGTYGDLGDFGVNPVAIINNQGRVLVGAIDPDGVHTHAYLSRPGSTSLEEIPSLLPGASVFPGDMNQRGAVVGLAYVDLMNVRFHAFVYFAGKMKDLGVLPGGDATRGSSINNFGQTVGTAYQFATGYIAAWIDIDGKLRDMNTLLSSSSKGWFIYNAYSINDRGQVVGMGSFDGATGQPVLLTPNAIMPAIAP